jgi:hypothetical protein
MRTLVLTAVLLVACKSSGGPVDELVPSSLEAWKASHPCPSGARHDLLEDGGGKRLYCILADDTKQGPFGSWTTSGQQDRGGIYDHDKQQLLLTWDSNGKIMTREVLRADGKQDVTVWDASGKPTTTIEDRYQR